MTGPVRVQVDGRDHFSLFVTLPEHDANLLLIGSHSFKCIGGTGRSADIALAVIDFTISHDLRHFLLRYLSAGHAAVGVHGVLEVRCTAVKSPVAVDSRLLVFRFGCIVKITLASLYKKEGKAEGKNEEV